jgi:Mn-dependent DtxR family transcriptional regulator
VLPINRGPPLCPIIRNVKEWLERDLPRADMAERLNVSRATLTRYLARLKATGLAKVTPANHGQSL